MASVTDIGIPGNAMNDPPLTPWQAAVRDALDSSDVTVNARIVAHETALNPHGVYLTPAKVVAGDNVTVDTTTLPGLVIIASTGGTGGGSPADSDQGILAVQIFS